MTLQTRQMRPKGRRAGLDRGLSVDAVVEMLRAEAEGSRATTGNTDPFPGLLVQQPPPCTGPTALVTAVDPGAPAADAYDGPGHDVAEALVPAARAVGGNRTAPRTVSKVTHEQPYEFVCGDCIGHMDSLPAGTVRLVFADPPYNQGVNYGHGKKADRQKPEAYLAWCAEWMRSCIRLLAPDGSLWVVISDEWADHFAVMLTYVGLHRRSWVKWYETFGVNCTRKFNRCSRHILHYVRDPKRFVFNRAAVSRPSDRQTKYNDKRANPAGKLLDDVWIVPRIAGTHRERIPGFPTQIPLEIMRRIVGCASGRADIVLDPFSGSATTGVAASESGRRYIGIEQSAKFCELSELRL